MSKRFYVTTAIDYVNGEPHLGHAYEKIIADVIARAQRSLGKEVFYLTGLDEHGQKVQQAADAAGEHPQTYCDQLAKTWMAFTKQLGLSNDDFVRTSEPRHKEGVLRILTRLHDAGHFYKASYRGYYSTKEETFLTDKDRMPNGHFDPIYGEVTELVEENFYFRLKPHQSWLIDHIESHPEFVYPDYRRNEVLAFLKNHDLENLCISRPKSRLAWGIPLAFDPNFVTYVWFDALVNYASIPASWGDPTLKSLRPNPISQNEISQNEIWPADIHIIGKDILKFHAIYWPIMLKAMGLSLPRQICVHGWWQKDGKKMSKSTGNIVDPLAVIDDWGLDAFRYYVIRELDIGPDGNWTDRGFQARYNAELANGLGNFVNRSLAMLRRYRAGKVPKVSDDLAEMAAETIAKVKQKFAANELQSALQSIWNFIAQLNRYIDQSAPFKLAKAPDQADRLDAILYGLAEATRILAILICPTIPQTAEKIFRQLNLSQKPNSLAKLKWGGLQKGHEIGEPKVLFPRRDLKKETT